MRIPRPSRTFGPAHSSVLMTIAWIVFSSSLSEAGIPEPDLIFYGTVKIDGVLQTSGGPTVLEVRQAGEVLPIPILATAPDPFYVARIPIESAQGGSAAGCFDFCLTLGGSASLWLTSPSLPGGELEVAIVELASRGRVVRQDIAASSLATDNDIDGDGVPDFRDNCINLLAGSSQLDTNGNGIGDACEGIDNPGLTFVEIGDISNPADPETGKGSVDYEYKIATTEITNADYVEFLNAIAANDPNGVYNELMGVDPRGGIVRDGDAGSYTYRVRPRMAIQPANFASWLDAARYANWEANNRPVGAQDASTTETGAFDLTVPDAATTTVRNPAAAWSLPTEDEFYKAAYFDPTLGANGEYWGYPTQSDSPPTPATATPDGRVFNAGAEIANFDAGADWNGQNGNVTAVGTAVATSFYGGADLAGNVEEWLSENAEPGPAGLQRVVRGGGFASTIDQLATTAGSSIRDEVLRDPLLESPDRGFRLVPEPGMTSLLLTGTLSLSLRTRRRKRA